MRKQPLPFNSWLAPRHLLLHADEFQDTNQPQYELIHLLCSGYRTAGSIGSDSDDERTVAIAGAPAHSLFVVGDPEQVRWTGFMNERSVFPCHFSLQPHNDTFTPCFPF